MRMRIITLLTALSVAAIVAQPANTPAQGQDSEGQQIGQQTDTTGTKDTKKEADPKREELLDEIVVTANSRVTGSKTSVSIHDTPATIAVVPKEIIEDQQAVEMTDMANNVAGLSPTIAGGYGFSDSFMLRGLNMRFLRDGLPDGNTWNGYMRTNTDIESIEVVKGPGSAVYGRSEPGGVVNVTTKKPLETLMGSLELMGGFYNTYRTVLDVGGPLGTATLPARLNASFYHTDGYRGLYRTISEILPSFTYKINEKHSLTVDYDYRNIEARPDNYGILFGIDHTLLPVAQSNVYYSPFNKAKQQIHRVVLSHEGDFSSNFKLRSSVIYDNRDLHIMRNARGAVDATGTKMENRSAREQGDVSSDFMYQTEAIIQFLTGEISHVLLGGVEAQYYKVSTWRTDYSLPDISNLINPIVPEQRVQDYTPNPSFDRLITNQTISAYAQEQVSFTDYLKVRAGARLDHTELKDDAWQSAAKRDRTIESLQDLFSWQAGAVYQPLKQVSIYSGYSAGQFMSVQTESGALSKDPEKSSQVELGNKLEFFDSKLQTNLALFYTTRENYYVTDTDDNSNPVGKRVTQGVEFDAAGNPFTGLWLTLSGAYYDAAIKSSEQAKMGATYVNTEGKKPQYVPEYTANFWATYELQSSMLKGLGFGGGPRFKSGLYVDALNLNRVSGYVVADAVLFYKQPNWQLQVNFHNITNEIYYATPSFSGALPGEPFNMVISAKAQL